MALVMRVAALSMSFLVILVSTIERLTFIGTPPFLVLHERRDDAAQLIGLAPFEALDGEHVAGDAVGVGVGPAGVYEQRADLRDQRGAVGRRLGAAFADGGGTE